MEDNNNAIKKANLMFFEKKMCEKYDEEIWKDIEEEKIPKGLYQISNLGRIRRLVEIKPSRNGNISLYVKGKHIGRSLHKFLKKYFTITYT